MSDETGESVVLRPKELRAVYAIGLAVAQSEDIDGALDQIVQHTRHVLIFDNMVLYLPKDLKGLNPTYARLIGRGKSAEGDIVWGETVANQAYETKHTLTCQEKLEGWEKNRLCWREFLGLPLNSGEEALGALVFGRFGGPPYTPDQIRLAEFIAAQTAQLIENHHLVERVAKLEAEKRLRRLQEDFIATVSHELRTPLGFIKGYATTLLREDASWDDAARREFLTIIDEEADRLVNLIEDLLDTSRLQSGTMNMQFQPVSLDQLLREVFVRATVRYPQLSMQLNVKPGSILQADPARITQVFDNLISNVVKYAPGSPVNITVVSFEGKFRITVEDQGPGITQRQLEHLFERFYRIPETSATVHGTGLGLFICQQIVRAHGGEISVKSEPSIGTTFIIDLPGNLKRLDDNLVGSELKR
jgi:signal transduction histidine kinase